MEIHTIHDKKKINQLLNPGGSEIDCHKSVSFDSCKSQEKEVLSK